MDDEGVVLTIVIVVAIIFIGGIVFAIVDNMSANHICDFTAEIIDKDWTEDEDGNYYHVTFYHIEMGKQKVGVSRSQYREIDIGDTCRFSKSEGGITGASYYSFIGK